MNKKQYLFLENKNVIFVMAVYQMLNKTNGWLMTVSTQPFLRRCPLPPVFYMAASS
jgi:hypothetical protein